MKTLLLFDIDGTLILNSNAGITAYLAAVKQHHKLHIRPDELSRSCGKTDFMIIRELLDYRQMQHASERDPELLQVYLEELKKALAADPGVLAPGIPELLAKLQAEEDFVLALGTGNIRAGAFLKLACHGLDRFFQTGGFAEDGSTRTEVIAAGLSRAEAAYSTKFAKVVVIGDTPSDVKCAQDNGFYAVAVATGSFTKEELLASGPNRVLDDLTDWAGLIDYIGGLA